MRKTRVSRSGLRRFCCEDELIDEYMISSREFSVLPCFGISYCCISREDLVTLVQPLPEPENPKLLREIGIDRIMDSFIIGYLGVFVCEHSVYKLMIPEQRFVIGSQIKDLTISFAARYVYISRSWDKLGLEFERYIYDGLGRLIRHEIEPGIFE
ncbi:MAG: hypothetical protein ACXACY_19095 [Candidatus Hodarchaeales archaeon]|jgi:hypothetical protein